MPFPVAQFNIPHSGAASSVPGSSPPFSSILFNHSDAGQGICAQEAPNCVSDLNLDQIIGSVTTSLDEYRLKPFFFSPVEDIDTIEYRHEAFRDLENSSLYQCIGSFAERMRRMRACVARSETLYHTRQKQFLFLDAAGVYCDAVVALAGDLKAISIRSCGFENFREYLTGYAESARFNELATDTRRLRTELSTIRYSLHIDGSRISIKPFDAEPDLSAQVLRTFEKFSQGAEKEYRFPVSSELEMNHIEAAILDLVARLYSEIFGHLDRLCDQHRAFADETLVRFDREVQFYIAWLEFMRRFQHAELSFCYPMVTEGSKEISGLQVFDLALADRLVPEGTSVVTNDFYLKNPERIIVISGPNQGGKTTFARAFGQLHYFARLGCPVPGSAAKLFFFDRLFTHFEREESIEMLQGKLEDELIRIRSILEKATPASILVMNESFLSTMTDDALFLSRQIIQRILELDMLCVSVTFLDELSSLSEKTVSMVSTVDPEDPSVRTFKIVRKPADGLAYAAAIAEKHKLSYQAVKARLSASSKREDRL
jgi:DNA mismatch repair protein MutS